MSRRPTRQPGFTLLELLVALLVFGIMSAMAYRGLVAVVSAEETLRQDTELLRELQFAVGLLERDLRQALPRPVRDSLGQPLPALLGGGPALEFTRAGWSNPLDRPRSRLERVGYRLDGEHLVRLSWPVLDRTQGTVAERSELLPGVTGLQVRFLDAGGEWQLQWPPPAGLDESAAPTWPRAVSVTLDSDHHGRIERLVGLVDPAAPAFRELPAAAEEPGDG